MIDVARKTPRPVKSPDPGVVEADPFVLRIPDKRLVEALDAISRQDRRSRNNTILIALEQFAASRGLWPPAN